MTTSDAELLNKRLLIALSEILPWLIILCCNGFFEAGKKHLGTACIQRRGKMYILW